jgi:aspartyl-tRNA(Asn)/glutamyl-tRNA(Gln) amidotransferase subunit A
LCGLVGFKPTQRRAPLDGLIPLSPTLDAVGVLGRSVGCCAVLDALLCDEQPDVPRPLHRPPRLAVPRNYLFADVEPYVGATFERATERLSDAGAEVVHVEVPELDTVPDINAGGGFPAAESYAWHYCLIAEHAEKYDPRVLVRIRRGERLTARDLLVLRRRRTSLIEAAQRRLEGFDAIICPTVPIVAPPVADLEEDDEYTRINLLTLRNPTVINLIDGCAASVPMHQQGEPPAGLMVSGLAGEDAAVLRIASWIEERL